MSKNFILISVTGSHSHITGDTETLEQSVGGYLVPVSVREGGFLALNTEVYRSLTDNDKPNRFASDLCGVPLHGPIVIRKTPELLLVLGEEDANP